MDKTKKLEQAWDWARKTRLEAIRQKREYLTALENPFEAHPGQETALEETNESIQALDVVLHEIENAYIRTKWEEAGWLGLPVTGALFSFGAASLATLGFAAACIVICAPAPAVQATPVIGTALSLAWAVKTAAKAL